MSIYSMKNTTEKTVLSLFLCFSLISLASCVSQRVLHFTESTEILTDDNAIAIHKKPIVRIKPQILDFHRQKFVCHESLLSKQESNYISTILQESQSSNDTLMAASNNIFVVKESDRTRKTNANYRYQLDPETGSWVCMYVNDMIDNIVNVNGSDESFLRNIYVIKKKNRVIVKDSFRGFNVIYVIQGNNKTAPFRTTSIWNPVDLPAMVTTTNYIKEHFDPISINIALSNESN